MSLPITVTLPLDEYNRLKTIESGSAQERAINVIKTITVALLNTPTTTINTSDIYELLKQQNVVINMKQDVRHLKLRTEDITITFSETKNKS